jgi:putative Holliday junction resolvase
MRVLAVDLGTRRIGVAVSDPSGTLASPYEVVQRSGDRQRDHRHLLALAEEVGAERVLVGLPLSLDGGRGPAAVAAQDEIDELAAASPVPVEACDERLTTVTAQRILREQGVPAKAQRQVVDKVAAAVMLQSWLDGRSAAGSQGSPR